MQANEKSENNARQSNRRLAFASAALTLLLAAGYAILLPSQIQTGQVESARWFAVSAFPLAVVVWIAVFTRLQRQLDQKYGPPPDLMDSRHRPQR